MTSKHKAFFLVMCAVFLVAVSVLGTLAYLTAQDTVTNTFTVGSVGLKLDEADVKTDGSYETNHDDRVKANEYHLLPGHTYYKDPTVTVEAGSEDAYVRMIVKVENIDQLKRALPNEGDTAKYYAEDEVFLLQMLCVDKNGTCTWNPEIWQMNGYTETENPKTGIYEFRYKEVVEKSETGTVLPELFTRITVPGEIDNEHLKYLQNVKIVVHAHAIQEDGFETADKAWEAFGNPSV